MPKIISFPDVPDKEFEVGDDFTPTDVEELYNIHRPVQSAGRQALGRFAQGLAGSLAGIPESAAIIANKIGDEFPSIDEGKPLTELDTYKLGKRIRETAEQLAPVDPKREKSFWIDTLPSAAGSMVGFLGAGGATKKALTLGGTKLTGEAAADAIAGKMAADAIAGRVAVAGVGAASGMAEGYEDAIRKGASPETAWQSGLINAGLGTTEAASLGRWIDGVNKASGGRLLSAVKEGTVEGAQEVLQQFGGNVTAKDILGYDPERGRMSGVLEGGAAGGILGGIAGLLIGGRRAGGTTTHGIPEPTTTPTPVQPDQPMFDEGRPILPATEVDRISKGIEEALSEIPAEEVLTTEPEVAPVAPQVATQEPEVAPITPEVATPIQEVAPETPAFVPPEPNLLPLTTQVLQEQLTAIQKPATLANGKIQPDQLQTGTQEDAGINREAATDDAASIERRNSEAADAWIASVSRNDIEAIRNIEKELLGSEEGRKKLKELEILVGRNIDWAKVRASGDYGGSIRQAAIEERTRSSQERRRIGQQPGKPSVSEPIGTREPSWEAALSGRNENIDQATARSVEQAIQQLSVVQDNQEQARWQRRLQGLLAQEFSEEASKEINKQLTRIPNALRKSLATESLFRQTRQELGLPQVVQGNTQQEVAAQEGQKEEVKPTPAQSIANAENAGFAAANTPEGKRKYRPAIRKSNGEILIGKTHGDIPEKGGQRGYVDSAGIFLTLTDVARRETGSIDRAISVLESKLKSTTDTTQAVIIPGLDPSTARAVWNTALRIAIGVLKATKNVQRAIQAGIDSIRKALADRKLALDAATESALRKDFENAVQEEPEGTPKQMGGRPGITAPRPVESIAATQILTREKYFDPTTTSQANNERWWDVVNRMTNPNTKHLMAADIQSETQTDIGQSLLLRDLRHYAVKMAASGDFSMFEHMLNHYNSMGAGVATGSGIAEASGRGLRGLRLDDAEKTLWDALNIGFQSRTDAVKKTLNLTGKKEEADIFNRLKSLLEQVNMTPEEFLDEINKHKNKTGKTAREIIEAQLPKKAPETPVETDESWQDKTAQSILDKMESSQTEWVKPEKPKDAIREYVRKALLDRTWPQIDSPNHTTRNVEAYIDKVDSELQALGVSPEFSNRLAWEISKERLNRWSLKNLKQLSRKNPDTIIQGFLTKLLNIKSPAKADAIQKILNDAKSRKLSVQDYAQPDQWKSDLQDRLVAAGASSELSSRVADELYTSKIPEFASSQAGKFQRASEDVPSIVRAILNAIKANPYRSQNAEWRRQTIQSYFEKAGLTPERAASVTKAMDLIFVVRESDARTKGAEQLLKERPARIPKEKLDAELDKLRKAIRIGLTDPDQQWTDAIAKVNKWKGFTKAEHERIGELMEKLDNPDTLSHERAKFLTELNKLISIHTPPNVWHELASYYSNNQLSGTGTALLSTVTPGFSSGIRVAMDAASGMLTGDFGKPLAAANAMMKSVQSMAQEFKFSMKYDAYTKRALQTIETMQNLYALMQRGKTDWENSSLSATQRASGLIRYMTGHVDMVRTFLSSTDQAWQSAISDYVKLMGSRELLKKAGYSDSEVRTMLNDVFMTGEQFYQEALARGLSNNDAKLDAKDRVWLGMKNMLDTEANARDVENVFKTGDLEAELEVGNYRGEGGWAQTALRSAMDAVQRANPLIYRLVFGFPRVNLNLLSRAAWYSPWGFKRLAFDYYQRKTSGESQYQQSMSTELQRRQRMAETIAGTAGFIALAALYAREIDKKDEDKLMWFDFAGPRDAVLKQAWLRSGHRPYTIGIKVGDKRVSLNWNRGGFEAVQVPFAVLGAYEDAKLNGRKDEFLTAMSDGIGLIGTMGTGRRDYTSEASLTYTAASKSSGFIPLAGLLRTVNKLSDAPDTKTIKGALIAATPMAPAFSEKPALNVLGDPVGDITTLRIQKLGSPVNVVTPDRLYQLMANAKEGPPRPSRNAAEQKNGLFGHPVTDEQWYEFFKTTGSLLKANLNKNYDKLRKMSPDELDKWLTRASNEARLQAKHSLKL